MLWFKPIMIDSYVCVIGAPEEAKEEGEEKEAPETAAAVTASADAWNCKETLVNLP